jgi:lysophospholipase L1-like esterase
VDRILTAVCSTLLLFAAPARAAHPLALADGDRVVWVGGTLIEREQRYGYWETLLTALHPDRTITFRNLGWSGDTVFGDARAGFGTAADGFRRLTEHVHALKPTVILVAYGANESFVGEPGLAHFTQGLNSLLDSLAVTKARIVLLAPPNQENLGPPLPDPAEHNRQLRAYRRALQDIARQRGYLFVDLEQAFGASKRASPLTDNGLHLTPLGYWRTSFDLAEGLGIPWPGWRVTLGAGGGAATAEGTKISDRQDGPLRFQALDACLPLPAPKGTAVAAPPAGKRILRVPGLPLGRFTLRIDGQPVRTATNEIWQRGVDLSQGQEFAQAEKLRAAVVEKNRLYFHRWRPQNETYLLGFRKHEQGKNAKEIVQFDLLVAAQEKEIARLRVLAAHRYEIVPERENSK